ncbi:glutathione S-transferase family protein [Paracoccus tegillarcae]|uniref:Glutathione S-transferase n=1 Tax=Paracoccus tegillarcae TaxID=1529068 RepID=A0A2K9EX17_9RHOB|nr:glutathione S-transferase family protein [Paracoccus tegillarcae]AUH35506.1 glutathione S-transferase [Paracoccus tegillarcae]
MRPTEPITIWGRADSSNVQAVMWGAAELGVPVTRIDAGHRFGGLDSADYRARNPHGRVPTMRDGDLVMWESCAILRYLASRYGDGGAFWPADPVARAQVDMWAEWAKHEGANHFTYPVFWNRIRIPNGERDEALLARNIARWEESLDRIEAQVSQHGWLAGPDFTLADIIAGHYLFRWFTMDIPRRPRPVIEGWYQVLQDRPAYRQHVMVSYDALRA